MPAEKILQSEDGYYSIGKTRGQIQWSRKAFWGERQGLPVNSKKNFGKKIILHILIRPMRFSGSVVHVRSLYVIWLMIGAILSTS